jgi:hypothetical protein
MWPLLRGVVLRMKATQAPNGAVRPQISICALCELCATVEPDLPQQTNLRLSRFFVVASTRRKNDVERRKASLQHSFCLRHAHYWPFDSVCVRCLATGFHCPVASRHFFPSALPLRFCSLSSHGGERFVEAAGTDGTSCFHRHTSGQSAGESVESDGILSLI